MRPAAWRAASQPVPVPVSSSAARSAMSPFLSVAMLSAAALPLAIGDGLADERFRDAPEITRLLRRLRWQKRRPWPRMKGRPLTKLYDRTSDEITLDSVERIAI
jgi:hypothetical protein